MIESRITAEPEISKTGDPMVILGFQNGNMQSKIGVSVESLTDAGIDGIAQMLRDTRDKALQLKANGPLADWERELLGMVPHGTAETVPVNGVNVIRNMADGSPRCWGLSDNKAQCGFEHGHMGVCSFDRENG